MIIFNKVTKKFKDGTTVLKNVSFSIKEGEFVFIIGPSGAGKTTVSRLLLKEIKPTKGKIFVNSQNLASIKKREIPVYRQNLGVAFQDFKIFNNRTAAENVKIPLEISGFSKKEIEEKVKQVLDLVNLKDKADLFPAQLSGGELQRIAIARALGADPKILFTDEPTGNLDQETGWEIINLLREINNIGTTVIVATHDVEVVDTCEERVIRLEKGELKEDKKKAKYK